MSGVSNVVHWLVEHAIEPDEGLVEEIFRAAKERDRVMTNDEVHQIVKFVTESRAEREPLPLDTLADWNQKLQEH